MIDTLDKSELQQICRMLELSDSRSKSELKSRLRHEETVYGPIFKELKQYGSKVRIGRRRLDDEWIVPKWLYEEIDAKRINRHVRLHLKQNEITIPIPTPESQTYFDQNFGWVNQHFTCPGCYQSVRDCDCPSLDEYIVAFLVDFFKGTSMSEDEIIFAACSLRFTTARLGSLFYDISKLRKCRNSAEKIEEIGRIFRKQTRTAHGSDFEHLKIPKINANPLLYALIDEWPLGAKHQSEVVFYRNSLQDMTSIGILEAISQKMPRQIRRKLRDLNYTLDCYHGEGFYCSSCSLPVYGSSMCYACTGSDTFEFDATEKKDSATEIWKKVMQVYEYNELALSMYLDKKKSVIANEKSRIKNYLADLSETERKKAELYLDQGLEIEFILPLVKGTMPAEDIMSFWNCKWRNQYSLDDSLIQLVLKGKVRYRDAEVLNEIRAESELLFQFFCEFHETKFAILKRKYVIGDLWSQALNNEIKVLRRLKTNKIPEIERIMLAKFAGVSHTSIVGMFGENQLISTPQPTEKEYGFKPVNNLLLDLNFVKGIDPTFQDFSFSFLWTSWNRTYFANLMLGYPREFAKSIADTLERGYAIKNLISFYNSNWRKQYSLDDYLVRAVLQGDFTPEQGEYLNKVRSNHEKLVNCVALEPGLFEWAKTLLEAGFDKHPKAVLAALEGAEPVVLQSLYTLKGGSGPLPPAMNVVEQVSAHETKQKTEQNFGFRNEATDPDNWDWGTGQSVPKKKKKKSSNS